MGFGEKGGLNRALKKVQKLEEGHPKSEEKMGHIPLHGSYVMAQSSVLGRRSYATPSKTL